MICVLRLVQYRHAEHNAAKEGSSLKLLSVNCNSCALVGSIWKKALQSYLAPNAYAKLSHCCVSKKISSSNLSDGCWKMNSTMLASGNQTFNLNKAVSEASSRQCQQWDIADNYNRSMRHIRYGQRSVGNALISPQWNAQPQNKP